MRRRITGVLTVHFKNKSVWSFIPWMVLFASFAINFAISFLLGGKTASYTGGIATIYIYAFIMGIVTVLDTFAFALGFSVRRIDYLLGTLAMMVIMSAFSAVLLLLLALIESKWTAGWGVSLHFFSLPYVNDGSFMDQLWIYFVVLLHMYLLGFLIAGVYQRFGRLGMTIFFTAAFLLASMCVFMFAHFNWWSSIGSWFAGHSAVDLSVWIFLASIVYTGVTYMLLRKAVFQ